MPDPLPCSAYRPLAMPIRTLEWSLRNWKFFGLLSMVFAIKGFYKVYEIGIIDATFAATSRIRT
jgi:hypothetical protein